MKLARILAWLDSAAVSPTGQPHQIDWLRVSPFVALHLACLGVVWVGVSATAIATAVSLYLVRMFAITAFYHRYFSHRSFRTSRALQFSFAVLGATAVQRGPLWWASHHRYHHAHSDRASDPHSPLRHGFLWSHCGWFLANQSYATRRKLVRDLARYPELLFLDRYDALAPTALATLLYLVGVLLAAVHPELGTSGAQLLVWGFCVSTVALYHGTFTINSLAHVCGWRRFPTPDRSRNNPLLALLTLGEGWHNNHHYFPGSVRQGFAWWEIDPTYYALRALSALGLVWDLRTVPPAMRAAQSSS